MANKPKRTIAEEFLGVSRLIRGVLTVFQLSTEEEEFHKRNASSGLNMNSSSRGNKIPLFDNNLVLRK